MQEVEASALSELTKRELEVLRLVADGYSNLAIAESLVISKRALEKYMTNVFRKLEVGDHTRNRRTQAALIYQRASENSHPQQAPDPPTRGSLTSPEERLSPTYLVF